MRKSIIVAFVAIVAAMLVFGSCHGAYRGECATPITESLP